MVVQPRPQPSLGSRSCCLRVRAPQCQRLAPLGLLTSNSSSRRWQWSTLYRLSPHPPPHHPHPPPLPGLWSKQVLQLSHPRNKGRLQAATITTFLWTLRWTTLMVKPKSDTPSFLPQYHYTMLMQMFMFC